MDQVRGAARDPGGDGGGLGREVGTDTMVAAATSVFMAAVARAVAMEVMIITAKAKVARATTRGLGIGHAQRAA